MPEFQRVSKKALLFLLSLTAHYHEKLRVAGKDLDSNQSKQTADYAILIETDEINKKFFLTSPEVARIEKELKSMMGNNIEIKETNIVSIKPEYYWFCAEKNRVMLPGPVFGKFYDEFCYFEDWLMKYGSEDDLHLIDPKYRGYLNMEKSYKFILKDIKIIFFPSKIFFDRTLSYSEKFVILWNLILRNRLKTQPTMNAISKHSGISERTIGKAKGKYPELFNKKKLYQPEIF